MITNLLKAAQWIEVTLRGRLLALPEELRNCGIQCCIQDSKTLWAPNWCLQQEDHPYPQKFYFSFLSTSPACLQYPAQHIQAVMDLHVVVLSYWSQPELTPAAVATSPLSSETTALAIQQIRCQVEEQVWWTWCLWTECWVQWLVQWIQKFGGAQRAMTMIMTLINVNFHSGMPCLIQKKRNATWRAFDRIQCSNMKGACLLPPSLPKRSGSAIIKHQALIIIGHMTMTPWLFWLRKQMP